MEEHEAEAADRDKQRRRGVALDDGTFSSAHPYPYPAQASAPGLGQTGAGQAKTTAAYIAEQEEALAQQTVTLLTAQLGVMKSQLSMALDRDYTARFTPPGPAAFPPAYPAAHSSSTMRGGDYRGGYSSSNSTYQAGGGGLNASTSGAGGFGQGYYDAATAGAASELSYRAEGGSSNTSVFSGLRREQKVRVRVKR